MKPLLQIALDNTSLEDAIKSLMDGVGESIDIIETGTLLLCAEGARVVGIIRAMYPDKKLVADFKIADAGSILGGLLLEKGPDYTTVICSADNNTKAAVKAEADKYGAVVQVELYGNWTFEDAQSWKELGITQVIYHRSRDAKGGWGQADIDRLKALCDMGMEVTATGGVSYDDLTLFKDLPLFGIICGRSIRDALNPKVEVLRMKARIDELWENEH